MEGNYGRECLAHKLFEEADIIEETRNRKPRGDSGDPRIDDQREDDPSKWANLIRDFARHAAGKDAESHILQGRTFGICFTRLRDALSQWRGYGKNGCALGFERSKEAFMRSSFDSELFNGAELISMAYGPGGVQEVASEIAKIGWNEASSGQAFAWPGFPNYQFGKYANQLARLKHDGFEEEKEIRLTIPTAAHSSAPEIPRDFRLDTQGRLLIPYLPVPIILDAIKVIRIGPGPSQEQNRDSLQQFVLRKSLGEGIEWDPAIEVSKTPYR